MSHLNYFEPFQSKSNWHEDQLTRAFLVVLKYSPTALFIFYDLARNKALNMANLKGACVQLPGFSEIDLLNIGYATQICNIENYIAKKILSILITDEKFEPQSEIGNSERGAVYDGVISFNKNITLIIENKPRSYNVWEEQLSPNISNASTNADEKPEIIKVAAIIEWKEIIKSLNNLIIGGAVNGAERLIISDYLDFINRNFPYLNPYDNLKLCNDYSELILKRIKNILISIASKEEYVNYHTGWTYYIKTTWPDLQKVGLEIGFVDDRFDALYLSLYYGDTANQAREFYGSKIDYGKIRALISKNWDCKPNFHVSFMGTNLVWFKTPQDSVEKYYNYWISNIDKIGQYQKKDLVDLISQLGKSNLIELDDERNEQLKLKIYDTKRESINVCPGLGLHYCYAADIAKDLDSKNIFIQDLTNRMKEGLIITGRKIDFIR
jgi:hypothetical protein